MPLISVDVLQGSVQLQCLRPRDVLEGRGGSEKGEGGLAGTPVLPGSPYGSHRRRATNFRA